MVSFQGTKVAGYAYKSQNAYMQTVKSFHEANPEKELVFRGAARNIIDQPKTRQKLARNFYIFRKSFGFLNFS